MTMNKFFLVDFFANKIRHNSETTGNSRNNEVMPKSIDALIVE